MRRGVGGIVIAVALIGLLFAAVATSGEIELLGDSSVRQTSGARGAADVGVAPTAPQPSQAPSPDTDPPAPIPAWIVVSIGAVILAVAAVYSLALVVSGWRSRPRLRWRRRWVGAVIPTVPDVVGAVIDEAEAQRAELLAGEPRNAIVRCWLRLEHDVAAAGLTRNRADTSAEFTERVLARYTIDSAAIQDLASLYREARFSRHEFDESSRRAALDALDRLHRALTNSSGDAIVATNT